MGFGYLNCTAHTREPTLTDTPDDRLTAFLAWRRRRALEAGLAKPEQVLDEWVFRRILLQSPKDIYALEDLRLLTAPLFAQYGDDLLALCQGRLTEDERPKSAQRREEAEIVHRAPASHSRGTLVKTRRSEPVAVRTVRRDDPPVSLHSSPASANKRVITDFEPGPSHQEWKGKPFEAGCVTSSFKFWETEFLEVWGALLEAVANGTVAPESQDELAIAQLTSRARKAAKEWEQAWVKVVLRRAYENQ
jgi:hypothetical protein